MDDPKNLDLSLFRFEEFIRFFFDRQAVRDAEQLALFRGAHEDFISSSPAVVVEHLTRLFTEFRGIAGRFTLPQLDKGLWPCSVQTWS